MLTIRDALFPFNAAMQAKRFGRLPGTVFTSHIEWQERRQLSEIRGAKLKTVGAKF